MSKQLTFPRVCECTHIYPDGTQEKVRYGQYEAVQIISENGRPVGGTVKLTAPMFEVEEVVKENGTKIVFDKPFYKTHGRLVQRENSTFTP